VHARRGAPREALERAAVAADDLDLMLVATCTPDYASMPSTASLVQHALGARRAGAFDLNAVRSGSVYALTVGRPVHLERHCRLCASGRFRRVQPHPGLAGPLHLRALRRRCRRGCAPAHRQARGLLAFEPGSDGARPDGLLVPAGGTTGRRRRRQWRSASTT
jgi:hypothetical protein